MTGNIGYIVAAYAVTFVSILAYIGYIELATARHKKNAEHFTQLKK